MSASAELRLLGGIRRDGRQVSLEEHVARYGEAPLELQPSELVDRVGRSGLSGRGGAAFPTAAKLNAVLRAGGSRPVVVANGLEGEPPSGKDKVLLAQVPHLVIDGAVLAARAVGAKQVIVATTAATRPFVSHALTERRGRSAGIKVQYVTVPDRFVAGEESALVHFLNGGPALPTFTPPRPYESGVGGAPTAVLNVETLAQLALIARYGAEWFRTMGTRDEPGSSLVTISGAVAEPGVYEVELGSPFAALLGDAGADPEAQAYLVGGYFGTWVDGPSVRAAAFSNAGLAPFGASLGARAIVVLPHDACGIAETARIARYLAGESAGQCGSCANGLPAIADSLEQLVTRTRAKPNYGVLRRRLGQVANRGVCRHPDGAVALVASALRVFPAELERHLHGQRCSRHSRTVVPIP